MYKRQLAEQRWSEAEALYRELEGSNAENPTVLLGLITVLTAQGQAAEAQFRARNFPASREYARVEALRPLIDAMVKLAQNKLPDDLDLDPMFRNSIRLAARGNHPAALDGLLDLLRQDKRYRGDLARQVFVGLLDLYPVDSPLARQYRAELASVLF